MSFEVPTGFVQKISNDDFTKASYEALSSSPTALSHEYDPRFYRNVPEPRMGYYDVETPFYGIVNGVETNQYKIAYTEWGDKGPLILMLHGVPTNRTQYYELQKRLAPFCRTISIDMLGMGESSIPLNYGQNVDARPEYESIHNMIRNGSKPWDWIFDTIYLEQIHKINLKGEPLIFIADDWGGGILSHYAARFSDLLLGAIWIDPIAFDGYPVSEIQAFGRASQLSDEDFGKLLGAADQTMVQIFKTMVFDPNVWNQYTLRNIKKTYIDVDYERSAARNGEDATSLTLRLHPNNMRVLTDRAAILSPALLLPYHPELNPKGVDYTKIRCKCKIIWGKQDNMMPERQMLRFVHVLRNAETHFDSIDNAGHFAAVDQPDAVAESIMEFILSKPEWRETLADVYVGFGGKHMIYKGDERHLIDSFRDIYRLM